MHLLNWLEKHLECRPGEKVCTEELLFRINEEQYSRGLDGISSNALGRVIQNYFSSVSTRRLRRGKVQKSFLMNLGYKIATKETPYEFENLKAELQREELWIQKKTEDRIKVTMVVSNVKVNHNPIYMTITFMRNNIWKLHIGDIEVDLDNVGISQSIKYQEDINDIINIVKKLRICCGKRITDKVVVRNNVVELVEFGGEKMRCVRTETCKRILAFSADSRTFSCLSCQRIAVVQPLSAKDFVELKEEDSKDQVF